jgi:iron-sulfur cluster assembly protein
MIELTETAAAAVHSAIAAIPKQIAGLRVAAEPGGCSGPLYEMGLVEAEKSGDLAYESHGVKIFVEPASLVLITGTTIDYVTGPSGTGFKFDNPAAKSKGGCGGSCC